MNVVLTCEEEVMFEVTEDTPPDMLTGAMDLRVTLPNGKTVKMSVQRSTPMMDLLVHITTAHKVSPGGHILHPIGERGVLPYKPSTPIGALDTWSICVVPRQQQHQQQQNTSSVHLSKSKLQQPFEQTFRLQVRLPRNQLYVTRLSPRTTLKQILLHVCAEKNLDPRKYQLTHTVNSEQPLDLTLSLSHYGITELALLAITQHTNNIMLHKEGSVSGDSLGGSSDESAQELAPPKTAPKVTIRKKGRAPKPPQPTVSGSTCDRTLLISHSRNSSDSSGYHEASVLSDAQPPTIPIEKKAVSKKKRAPPPPPCKKVSNNEPVSNKVSSHQNVEMIDNRMEEIACNIEAPMETCHQINNSIQTESTESDEIDSAFQSVTQVLEEHILREDQEREEKLRREAEEEEAAAILENISQQEQQQQSVLEKLKQEEMHLEKLREEDKLRVEQSAFEKLKQEEEKLRQEHIDLHTQETKEQSALDKLKQEETNFEKLRQQQRVEVVEEENGTVLLEKLKRDDICIEKPIEIEPDNKSDISDASDIQIKRNPVQEQKMVHVLKEQHIDNKFDENEPSSESDEDTESCKPPEIVEVRVKSNNDEHEEDVSKNVLDLNTKEETARLEHLQQQFAQWQEQLVTNQNVLQGHLNMPLQSLQVLREILPQMKQKQNESESEAANVRPSTLPRGTVRPTSTYTEPTAYTLDRRVQQRYCPPTVNLGTWSERPKSQVVIKQDSDYRIGVGQQNANSRVTESKLKDTTNTSWKIHQPSLVLINSMEKSSTVVVKQPPPQQQHQQQPTIPTQQQQPRYTTLVGLNGAPNIQTTPVVRGFTTTTFNTATTEIARKFPVQSLDKPLESSSNVYKKPVFSSSSSLKSVNKKQTTTTTSNNVADRDQLMDAIRNFGGRTNLRKTRSLQSY